MRSGTLREKITLQSQTTTRSATGAITKVWADVATVRAMIEPDAQKSGREFFSADRVEDMLDIRVIIRYSTDVNGIDTSWRVKYGTRYFDIKSAANWMERNEMIVMRCEESAKDDE